MRDRSSKRLNARAIREGGCTNPEPTNRPSGTFDIDGGDVLAALSPRALSAVGLVLALGSAVLQIAEPFGIGASLAALLGMFIGFGAWHETRSHQQVWLAATATVGNLFALAVSVFRVMHG